MRIVAHIGAGKCGSSAIQAFLAINKQALLEQGFLAPPSNLADPESLMGNQVGYFERMRKENPDLARSAFLADLARIEDSAPPGAHTMLLSAENLSNPPPWSNLFGPIADRLSVIAYIRRQDDYLESAWQQWFCKSEPSMRSWLRNPGALGDWKKSLQPWLELIGPDAMTVRKFAKEELREGDVVKDYVAVVGIDAANLRFPKETNVTLNAGFTRLLELSQGAHKDAHDSRLYDLVCKLTRDRHLRRNGGRLLSGEERIALLRRFESSNAWVRDHFFSDLAARGAPLFDLSDEEAGSTAVSADVMEGQLWAIVVDLLLCIAERDKGAAAPERERPEQPSSG